MVRDTIREYMDVEKFNAAIARQKEARRGLQQIADQYPTIVKWIAKKAGKSGKNAAYKTFMAGYFLGANRRQE